MLNESGEPDGPLEDLTLDTSISISAPTDRPMKVSMYVYIATYENDILKAVEPVDESIGLSAKYLLSEGDNGPTFDTNTQGITIKLSKEEGKDEGIAAKNNCYYSFEIENAYNGFSQGEKFYDIRPTGRDGVANASIEIQLGDDEGEGDNSGLTLRWDDGNGTPIGEPISDGDTIEIEEGCGYSLLAYIDGKQIAENESLLVDTDADNVCNAGFSPDNECMEIYLTTAATVGDECTVSVGYRDGNSPIAEFKIKVVKGITLDIGNGNVVKNGGTISKSVTAQILYGGEEISEGYDLKTVGKNAVYSIEDKEGKLEIKTVGNGTNGFSVIYGKKEYTFNYVVSGVKDDADGAQNFKLKLTDSEDASMVKEIATGEDTYFMVGKKVKIEPLLNNAAPSDGSYAYELEGSFDAWEKSDKNKCNLKNGEGSYYLDTAQVKGEYQLWLTVKNESDTVAKVPFYIRVINPESYVLQFYEMEQVNEKWEHTDGFATFEVFKKNTEARYFKFIVTDEEMRQINNEFVDVTSDNINVLAFVAGENGKFDWRPINDHPFKFETVSNEKNMLKVSYDRSKDKYGPLYMFEYTGENEYLKKPDSDKCVAVYTRKLIDIFDWDKMKDKNNDNHWRYSAYLEKHPCSEENDNVKDNKDCDVKNAVVELPKDLFGTGENQIEIVEDKTQLDIETDFATINFDDDVLQQIDEKDCAVTLDVKTLEDEDKVSAEYAAAKDGFKSATAIIDLKLYEGESGTISNFGDGCVTVYWEYELKDSSKTPKVYYVDADGKKTEMECEYDETANVIIFMTNHFSLFAVEETTASSSEGGNTSGSGSVGGGAAAAAPEVTTDTAASTTTSKTDVKLTESTNADGTSSSTANVSVSAANQKEILKQAAAKKSENIVLNVSAADTKNADTVEVTLDKSFIESIINDTNATLTVKTPLGDKTYTQDELKALAAAADGKTVTITIAKSDEKSNEEMQQQAQQGAAKASMKARSSKTAKGNIKVVFRPDDETENFISEMKALGYTVKYRFYRSTKKSSGYKSMLTKSGKTYINTSGKAGTRYYYKVQVRVYDENGKCVAKTALKQCKYATRVFG